MNGSYAVVTGGARGLGLELCRQLAGHGWHVFLSARDLGRARVAAETLAGEGLVAEPVRLDVTDAGDIERLVDRLGRDTGRLDLLVNNAAIHWDRNATATTADLTVVREAMETNVYGPLNLIRACVPALRSSDHAQVINISSTLAGAASIGIRGPAYCLSKAALNMLTRMLALELAGEGIRVNSVCPGWLATDMGGPEAGPIPPGAADVVWVAEQPPPGPTGQFIQRRESTPW